MHQEMRADVIVQGENIVTTPPGQIPILTVSSMDEKALEWMEKLAMAIQFLNCGSPSVTIWARMLKGVPDLNRLVPMEVLRKQVQDLLPDDPTRYELEETAQRPGELFNGTLSLKPRTIKYDPDPDPAQKTE
jgi:hypothetical protein